MQDQIAGKLVDVLSIADVIDLAPAGEQIPSGGIIFHYSRQANFNVITWSNHGLTYALVSSLPGSGRQSCMVCHQDIQNGDRFSAHR